MTDSLTPQTAEWALRERARMNGLELSEAEVRDLQPYYDQHQRWLEELRLVLGDGEEPATKFSVVGAGDVPE